MIPLEITDTPNGKALLVQAPEGTKLPRTLTYCGHEFSVMSWSAPWHTFKYGVVRYAYL